MTTTRYPVELEFTNLDELVSHLTTLAVNKNNVFRGYNKQSELFPNLIRDKDWRDQEFKLLREFERFGLQYFSANNPIDFMSYAQHYGLPTRLLDFTYNPFIALYFALFTAKSTNYSHEDDKTYYYIRFCNLQEQLHIETLPYYEDNLFQTASFSVQCDKMINLLDRIIHELGKPADDNEHGIRIITNYFARIYCDAHPGEDIRQVTEIPRFKKFIDDEITKLENRKILFIDANQCNQRIVMQQGLFMFPFSLNRDEHLEILNRNTSVIKIHKSLRIELLTYLDTIGINAFRLMPDLQSVCHAVKRKVLDDRQHKSPLFKKYASPPT